MNRALAAAVLLSVMAPGLWSEEAPASPTRYEVATIKPNATGDHRVMLQIMPGGRFQATGVTLKFLMQEAYGVRDFQISGGPSWMNTDRWDIVAKGEGLPDRVPPEQFRSMLTSLIEERFQVKFHRETKEMPVYNLVAAKGGPKVTVHGGASAPRLRMGRAELDGTSVPLAMLAQQLSQQLGRTVVDKTGLTGDYDFSLKWTPEPGQGGMPFGPPPGAPEGGPAPADPNRPSIFTAVQEQLGLKLESDKGPVQMLVLDRVERPSEN